MDFLERLDVLFPNELSDPIKGRLKEGLSQFVKGNSGSKIYTDFYSTHKYDYFLQGDLLREIRFPIFDNSTKEYEKLYYDAIIISNACDIDSSNQRNVPKRVMVSKLIPLDEFINDIRESGENIDIKSISDNIKSQSYSNILYIPHTNEGIEYIVPFDEVSYIFIDELDNLKNDIEVNRIEVLDYFGFYLFVFKLSFHFCRLPEENYRKF